MDKFTASDIRMMKRMVNVARGTYDPWQTWEILYILLVTWKSEGRVLLGLGCVVSNIRIRFYEQKDARRWRGFNELRQI